MTFAAGKAAARRGLEWIKPDRGQCSGNRLRILVFAFVFLSPDGLFLTLANALRLKEVERQGKSDIEPLAAQPAANRKLKQSQTGNV
jgi:hypothetical protein